MISDMTSLRDLAESGAVVVKFGATWCKPCQDCEADYKKLAKEFSHCAKFMSSDIDECPEFFTECNVLKLPSFLIYTKNGPQLLVRSIYDLKREGSEWLFPVFDLNSDF
jgi:thiol-disulfide isomerase/thioredoxin